jgi:exosortase
VPGDSNRQSISRWWSRPLFATLLPISIAIWWTPLTFCFALALRDDQYTHILLILPISAALIFLDWKSPEPPSGSAVIIGSVLLGISVVLNAVTRWKVLPFSADVQLSLNMLALVLWWIAGFALCFGARAFRRALFPLLFLLWMVPFPNFVLSQIVNLLQRGSAAAAHLLFLAVAVPVAQRGLLLHIPGLTMEVAPECSSIRSSLFLVVTTMVLAYLFLRSFWRRALVIAVAIPLSVAKNGLRIFVLGVLATRVDPSFMMGRLHRQGGIIYFLIALATIFLLLWILRRGEEKQPGETTSGYR